MFTLGQAGKPEHVLMPGDIPVIHVDRGGQVTYHGPGQIVAYPLLDLKRLKIGVRDYVCKIEQAIIDTWPSGTSKGAPRGRARRLRQRRQGRRARHPRAPRLHLPRPGLQHRQRKHRTVPAHQSCGYQGLEVVAMGDLAGPSRWTRSSRCAGADGETVRPVAMRQDAALPELLAALSRHRR